MATYRNGIETRDALYCSARRNFAAKGYFNTSIKDIVTDVNSKLGLFTYYFESKESLALEILYEIETNVYAAMERSELAEALAGDVLLNDLTRERVWLQTLAINPHVARFESEISATSAFMAHHLQAREAFFHALCSRQSEILDLNRMFSRDYATLVANLQAGMFLQFAHDIGQLHFEKPLEDVLEDFLRAAYGLFVTDVQALEKAIVCSRGIAEDVHLAVDDDLNVTYR